MTIFYEDRAKVVKLLSVAKFGTYVLVKIHHCNLKQTLSFQVVLLDQQRVKKPTQSSCIQHLTEAKGCLSLTHEMYFNKQKPKNLYLMIFENHLQNQNGNDQIVFQSYF